MIAKIYSVPITKNSKYKAGQQYDTWLEGSQDLCFFAGFIYVNNNMQYGI